VSKAFVCAVRLLARREHGAHELVRKLVQKGHDEQDTQKALDECQRLGLQSDVRFVESLCRARIRQGYGPQRIVNDLQQAKVDRDLIDSVLEQEKHNWLSHAVDAWTKKYKEEQDQSYAIIQKQKQFLLYRGFSMDTINQVFKERLISFLE